jgi:Fe-S-cluster containining protein
VSTLGLASLPQANHPGYLDDRGALSQPAGALAAAAQRLRVPPGPRLRYPFAVPRAPDHRYLDPLAQVWLGTAARLRLRIVRSADAYAATDGGGTLVIGDDGSLDADDSLAQMIFHELCHWLVQGEDAYHRADWGLDNVGDGDVWREHATLRTQAVLAGRHGLRRFFAPTTDFRASFWDGLPGDVLADRGDPSVVAAIAALRRAATPPWAPHLERALAATAAIASTAADFVPVARLVRDPDMAPLYAVVDAVPARHPSGLPAAATTDGGCATCAWRYQGGPGRRAARCRQADGARVDDTWPACERYEPALDCQTCGACCREAYGAVDVAPRDPAVRAQPGYIVPRGDRYEIRRQGERCAALGGGEVVATADGALTTTRYGCVIYDDRPRTCREFTLGSAHCLTARRRVGLSL